MKKKIISLLLAIMILCMAVPALASAEEHKIEVPPADEIAPEGTTMVEAVSLTRGNLTGGGSFLKLSSTSAQCHGYSKITTSNSNLKVILYLQQYKNGTWNTYKSISKTIEGTEVALTKVYDVQSGYYYRLQVEHKASGESSTKTITQSVLF